MNEWFLSCGKEGNLVAGISLVLKSPVTSVGNPTGGEEVERLVGLSFTHFAFDSFFFLYTKNQNCIYFFKNYGKKTVRALRSSNLSILMSYKLMFSLNCDPYT